VAKRERERETKEERDELNILAQGGHIEYDRLDNSQWSECG